MPFSSFCNVSARCCPSAGRALATYSGAPSGFPLSLRGSSVTRFRFPCGAGSAACSVAKDPISKRVNVIISASFIVQLSLVRTLCLGSLASWRSLRFICSMHWSFGQTCVNRVHSGSVGGIVLCLVHQSENTDSEPLSRIVDAWPLCRCRHGFW